jgi:MtN3 and saliva related transmembrane protein
MTGAMTELTGWVPATVLLATMSRQVYTQWRDETSQGVSKWLFIGQLAASSGFVLYSWLLGNWVFVVTNVLMLLTAGLGQWIYLGNKRGVVHLTVRDNQAAGDRQVEADVVRNFRLRGWFGRWPRRLVPACRHLQADGCWYRHC